jgi:hypothetical protein
LQFCELLLKGFYLNLGFTYFTSLLFFAKDLSLET